MEGDVMETKNKYESTIPKWAVDCIGAASFTTKTGVADLVMLLLAMLGGGGMLWTTSLMNYDSILIMFDILYGLMICVCAIPGFLQAQYLVARWTLKRVWKKATDESWEEGSRRVRHALEILAQGVAGDPEPMKKCFYAARDSAAVLGDGDRSDARIRDFVRGTAD